MKPLQELLEQYKELCAAPCLPSDECGIAQNSAYTKFVEELEPIVDYLQKMLDFHESKTSEIFHEYLDADDKEKKYTECEMIVQKSSAHYDAITCLNHALTKHRWAKIDFGDLFTLEEFIQDCNERGFIDYDGSGCYSDGIKVDRSRSVKPSDITDGIILPGYTHVVWYNR